LDWNLQGRPLWGDIIKKRLLSFQFEKPPSQLVPFQYLQYEDSPMLEGRAGVDLGEYRVFGRLLPPPPHLTQMRNYSMSKNFTGGISLEPVSQCTWSVTRAPFFEILYLAQVGDQG